MTDSTPRDSTNSPSVAAGSLAARSSNSTNRLGEVEWNTIRESLHGLRYGNVTIVVQDGVVVQVDRTEKRRLRRSPNVPDPQS